MFAIGLLTVTTKDKQKYININEQPSMDLLFSATEPVITSVVDSTRYFILDASTSNGTLKNQSTSLQMRIILIATTLGKHPRLGIAFENRKESAEFLEAVGITPKPYEPPVDPVKKKKDHLKRILDAAGVTEEDLKVHLSRLPLFGVNSFLRTQLSRQ